MRVVPGKSPTFIYLATDGKEMWAQRLKGPISASPVLVDGAQLVLQGAHYLTDGAAVRVVQR